MSTLIVCGFNHQGSSVSVRERIAMPKHCLMPALRSLVGQAGVSEAVILSTCNRTEVYLIADNARQGEAALNQFFAHAAYKHDGHIQPNLTAYDDDAVSHLFCVASGFESIVTGEGQILGQVGEAIHIAREAKTAGPYLNKLFNLALHCGKRVRTETGISRRAVSVASAAVELARHFGTAGGGRKILIIGAGKIGSLCAKHLIKKKSGPSVTIFNKSQPRLDELPMSIKHAVETTTDRANLARLCRDADAIFVTTAAEEYTLTAAMLSDAEVPKVICDLSMPRNVEPAVRDIHGIRLFIVDDLQSVVEKNLQARERLIAEAQPILDHICAQYRTWTKVRNLNHEFAASHHCAIAV